jgi:hypothetical protein
MLSVRLPEPLASQLAEYCEAMRLTKTAVVHQALETHMKAHPAKPARKARAGPFLAMLGSATRKISTDELMRLTRGNDWNKP